MLNIPQKKDQFSLICMKSFATPCFNYAIILYSQNSQNTKVSRFLHFFCRISCISKQKHESNSCCPLPYIYIICRLLSQKAKVHLFRPHFIRLQTKSTKYHLRASSAINIICHLISQKTKVQFFIIFSSEMDQT